MRLWRTCFSSVGYYREYWQPAFQVLDITVSIDNRPGFQVLDITVSTDNLPFKCWILPWAVTTCFSSVGSCLEQWQLSTCFSSVGSCLEQCQQAFQVLDIALSSDNLLFKCWILAWLALTTSLLCQGKSVGYYCLGELTTCFFKCWVLPWALPDNLLFKCWIFRVRVRVRVTMTDNLLFKCWILLWLALLAW